MALNRSIYLVYPVVGRVDVQRRLPLLIAEFSTDEETFQYWLEVCGSWVCVVGYSYLNNEQLLTSEEIWHDARNTSK